MLCASKVLRLLLSLGLVFVASARVAAAVRSAQPEPDHAVERVVSLSPSLTAIVLALGARGALVGVDDWSAAQQPGVADLPCVGGLYNPSLEAVVALHPEVVVLVPSAEQRDFSSRLEALGIRVARFDNVRFDEVLENIERLGHMLGHAKEARERIAAIRRVRRRVSHASAGHGAPDAVVVLQRDPLFVAGRGNFIDEMVTALGAHNLAAELSGSYPRAAVEWLVSRAPEVLIDLSPDSEEPASYWARWPSIPAVAHGRVVRLDADRVSLPGPWLDRSLELLAVALYGPEVAAVIEHERTR